MKNRKVGHFNLQQPIKLHRLFRLRIHKNWIVATKNPDFIQTFGKS